MKPVGLHYFGAIFILSARGRYGLAVWAEVIRKVHPLRRALVRAAAQAGPPSISTITSCFVIGKSVVFGNAILWYIRLRKAGTHVYTSRNHFGTALRGGYLGPTTRVDSSQNLRKKCGSCLLPEIGCSSKLRRRTIRQVFWDGKRREVSPSSLLPTSRQA